MSALRRVFVYGTLMRERPNHYLIADSPKGGSATFVGRARTEERFPLVVATRFGVPYMLDRPGQGHQITGEVELLVLLVWPCFVACLS
jgi:gamma-glutamylaminecyclotransferase